MTAGCIPATSAISTNTARLYVCGRAKDVIVIAGKNIYPTDIERAACAVPGVRAGNAVAVRIDAGDVREGFAVLAESRLAADTVEAERIRAEITRAWSKAVGYTARRRCWCCPPSRYPRHRRASCNAARQPNFSPAWMPNPRIHRHERRTYRPAIVIDDLRIDRGGRTVLDASTFPSRPASLRGCWALPAAGRPR